jgi:heme/copper-type cytochrome/quinol oxidase subunit 3
VHGKNRLGVILFIASEATFFGLLIFAYVTYHATRGNGPTAAGVLDPVKTGIFSVFLFSSSATMHQAGSSLRRRNRTAGFFWLMVTLAFGATFLVGQGTEYLHLARENVTISRDLFGTTFFTLTGFHGLHVLVGLVLIALVLGLTWAGKRDRPWDDGLDAISLYWHFVDAVWVVIFAVVYLWGVL